MKTITTHPEGPERLALILRGRAGDQQALDTLIRQNMGLIARLALRSAAATGWCLESEDAVQEGVLGFIRAVQTFDPGRNVRLGTWAGWQIRHAVQDAVRHLRRSVSAYPLDGGEDFLGREEAPPEAAGAAELRCRVATLLDGLGERHRQALLLRYGLDGEPLTLEAIGRHFGVSKESARLAILGALRKARDLLDDGEGET